MPESPLQLPPVHYVVAWAPRHLDPPCLLMHLFTTPDRPSVRRSVALPYAGEVVPVPLLSSGADTLRGLPPFGLSRVFSEWSIDPILFVGMVWVAGLYLWGVWTLHARGDHWPVGRSVAFLVGGVGSFAVVTQSGLSSYDTALLSVHMVQHMVLTMVVPLFLALGAPVTLALRALRRRPRGWLLVVIHSWVAKLLTFPPLTLALFIVTPWALYFSGWYGATLHSSFLHEVTHVHLVLAGSLFFWPLLGIDPVPGRVSYPFRLLMIFLSLPFHAFLGVTIMSQTDLIGGSWYPALHQVLPWLPNPADDQHLAGGILWASGDLVGLLFFAVLFVQWVRSSIREAAREDRRLDRLERSTGG